MRRQYKIFPALVFLLLLPATVLTQETLWKAYIDAGIMAYFEQHYVEAERRFKLACKEAESFGPQDPRLASSLYYLTLVYFKNPDKSAEALQLARKARAIWEKTIWENHREIEPLEVAGNLESLAGELITRGYYGDVELLLTQSLAIRRKFLKPQHPTIARTLSYIAITNYGQKKYDEASSHFREALGIYTEANDTARHEDIITALRNFATINKSIGNYKEAELFLQRALEFRQKNLEPEYSDINIFYELASLYSDMQKLEEAERVLNRGLKIMQKVYGSNGADIALKLSHTQAMTDLAFAYTTAGNYSKAESIYKEALAILEKPSNNTWRAVVRVLKGLYDTYVNQEAYADAEPILGRCLEIIEGTVGTENADFANYLNYQGAFFLDREKYVQAETVFKRSLEIRERVLKPAEHADIATSLNNLAKAYYYQGKYEQAEPLYQRAISITEKLQPLSLDNLAWYTKNYALLLYAQGKKAQAEETLRKAFEMFAKSRDNTSKAVSFYELAELYRRQKNYAEAEIWFKQALALMDDPKGQGHYKLAATLVKYASLMRETNREAEALTLEARAEKIRARYARKP
jgi:tetratricopeptide (TPR) repeat protein